MKQTKLIQLLSTFSKQEMRQCLLWLKSPLHNESNILVRLFEAISPYHPKFAPSDVNPPGLFAILYPGNRYADDLMRKNLSNLYNQCLAYLSWQISDQHPHERSNYLLNALLLKHQYKDLLFEINNAEKKLQKEKSSLENIRFNLNLSYYRYKAVFMVSEKKGKQGNKEKFDAYTDRIQAKLDALFTDLISDYLIYLSYSKVYKFNIEQPKDDLIEALYKETSPRNDLIAIYYRLYILQSSYTDKNLETVFKLLEAHCNNIAPKNLHNLLNILINIINDNFNLDSLEVERQRFRLYKMLTEPAVLLANDPVLNAILFSNIVNTYVNHKEFKRARNFMDAHIKDLDADLQIPYSNLALARWHFAQQQYDEAQICLMKTGHLEPHLRFRARLILAQVYYFKSEFSVLFSYLESTTKFLQRDKNLFPAGTRKSIFLFLTCLSKLAKLRLLPTKAAVEKLRTKLVASDNFLLKDWLLQELDKLK